MVGMDTLVETMLDSPLLPQQLERLNQALADERARRERFYETITENDRWEFINGEIFMHSPSRWCHAEALGLLSRLLGAYASRHALGTVVTEKAMVSLKRNDYEPDLCFFRKEVADTFAPDRLKFPAPDLIAEILSPSTKRHDRGIKKRDYAAHGVREYWIVDPDAQTVEPFTLHGEDYQSAALLPADAELTSAVIPRLSVPVRALFDQAATVAALTALLATAPSA